MSPTDGSPPLGDPLNPSLPSHRATTNFSPVRTVAALHVTNPVSSTSTSGVASAFVVAVTLTPALYLLLPPLPSTEYSTYVYPVPWLTAFAKLPCPEGCAYAPYTTVPPSADVSAGYAVPSAGAVTLGLVPAYRITITALPAAFESHPKSTFSYPAVAVAFRGGSSVVV